MPVPPQPSTFRPARAAFPEPLRPAIRLALLLGVVLTGCQSTQAPAGGVTVKFQEMDGSTWEYQSLNFTPVPPSAASISQDEQALLDLVNESRRQGGECRNGASITRFPARPALNFEAHLDAAANAYAQTLTRRTLDLGGGEDPHLNPANPTGRTPARRMVNAGFTPFPKADERLEFLESIAFGQTSPAEVFNAWKEQSPAHCLALYSEATNAGLAAVDGLPTSQFTRYWVLNVGGAIPR